MQRFRWICNFFCKFREPNLQRLCRHVFYSACHMLDWLKSICPTPNFSFIAFLFFLACCQSSNTLTHHFVLWQVILGIHIVLHGSYNLSETVLLCRSNQSNKCTTFYLITIVVDTFFFINWH